MTIVFVNGIKNLKNPLRSSFFSLFDDVDKNSAVSLELSITNEKELGEKWEQINLFCQEQKLDTRSSYYVQLFFEELSVLIIEHGFAEKKHPSLSLRLYMDTDGLILRSKDNCRPFNATEQKQMYQEAAASDKYMGIQMVFRLARKVDYVNTMNINQFIVHI